ncbi:MAG: hypothetical protein JJU36_08845 [Phycisphaeraceae bacterium]|nr:hypothetical protein [Phycisphaeraceae bacterium]
MNHLRRASFCLAVFLLGMLLWPSPGLAGQQAVLTEQSAFSYAYIARGQARKNIGQELADWPAPPAGYPDRQWYAPAFDDRAWPLATGRFPSGINRWGYGNRHQGAGSILLRARFDVSDPASAQLRLNMRYLGGAVVYLNGQPIARGHMPEGEITFDTPAEEYPKEAYYTHEGNPTWRVADDVDGPLLEHMETYRLRRLEDIALPREALVRGENVLAIMLNAAPQPDQHRFFEAQGWERVRDFWAKCALIELTLTGTGATGAAANTSHVAIRAANPLQEVDSATADALAKLSPGTVRLVGPRNGIATAPIVVRSNTPIESPRIAIGSLTGPDRATINSDRFTILYGSTEHRDRFGGQDGFESAFHHVLSRTPTPSSELHSAWLEVAIPPDATPGEYTGQVTVEAGGARQVLPIILEVGRFVMPETGRFEGIVGLMHNFENTAARYGVPIWSDEHFKLLEEVFGHMASVGNNVLWIPMALDTHFGAPETLVRWVKRGDGYEVDLSHARRYLKLYDEICGQPRFLSMLLWDVIQGGRRGNEGTATVTIVDPDTGTVSRQEAPWFGTRGGEEFWKPAIDGILKIMDELGWSRDAALIGVAHDGKPSREVVDFFSRIAPDVKWNVYSHSRGYSARDGRLVIDGLVGGFHEQPWGGDTQRRRGQLIGGWNHHFPQVTVARFHFHSYSGNRRMPGSYRTLAGASAADGSRNRSFQGVSRFMLDYWPIPRDTSDSPAFRRTLDMRGHVNLMRNSEFFLAPGPEGPEPTTSFQQFREGVQETQARIAIEQVLDNSEQRTLLSESLQEAAHDVIHEHANMLQAHSMVAQGYPALPWQDHARRLFDIAGQVVNEAEGNR